MLIRAAFPPMRIVGISRQESVVDDAMRCHIIDTGGADLGILNGCEVVWICTPLETIRSMAFSIAAKLDSPAVITDIGSVKMMVNQLELPNGHCFIPGHPMAGGEKIGFTHANPQRLMGAPYIIVPNSDPRYRTFGGFLEMLGFRVVELSAACHDDWMARISHVPYLLSGIAMEMATTVSDGDLAVFASILGPGFRDVTRVSGSDPNWGAAICELNRTQILAHLSMCEAKMTQLRLAIESENWGDVRTQLTRSSALRHQLFP